MYKSLSFFLLIDWKRSDGRDIVRDKVSRAESKSMAGWTDAISSLHKVNPEGQTR